MVIKVAVAYDILRWEEKALINAVRAAGAEALLLHTEVTTVNLSSEDSGLSADVVLQRCTSHTLAVESTVVLEGLGLRVINSLKTVSIAVDKVWTASVLKANKIPTPVTAVAFSPDAAFRVAEELGYPVVVKPVNGSWGRMICLARDREELRAIIEHRRYLPGINSKVYIIQEYVRKPGRDLRVFVVGDEVPVAIYRISQHWITNTARGGRAVKAEVDSELEDLALRTAKAVGGEVLGIDVLEDPERGYLINEVNAMAEFKNTVRSTGCDLHVKIAKYAISLAKR